MSDESVLAVEEHAVAGEHLPRVHGQVLDKLPEDLYIPPDALEVFLEAFEGPLDLLLYLIRRQNLNILDIPVLQITQQYLQYIELMREMRLELAAEYLLMAALLAEIKSAILLPRPPAEDAEAEGDPRMELVRRLQEYERFRVAGERIDSLPRVGRDVVVAQARPDAPSPARQLPMPSVRDLLFALRDVMQRVDLFKHHHVSREPLSVRARMSQVLARLRQGPLQMRDLIDPAEGRAGVVVCFLALLELARSSLVEIRQAAPFDPLLIGMAGSLPAMPVSPGANAGTEEPVDPAEQRSSSEGVTDQEP